MPIPEKPVNLGQKVDIAVYVNNMQKKYATNPHDVQKTLAQILKDFHSVTNADLKLLDVIVHDEKNPNGRKMSLQEFGKEAIMNHDMAIIMALGKALKDPKFVTGEVLPRKSENDSRLGRNPDADLMRMEVVLGPKSKTPTTNVVMGPAQVDPRSTNNLNGRVNNLNQSSAPQQMAETIKYDNFKGFIIALSEMGFYPEV